VRLCLLALSLAVIGSPAGSDAQLQPASNDLKSPTVARNYALYMPAGGYLYTGETGRAAVALGITALAAYKVYHAYMCGLTYPNPEPCANWQGPWLAIAFVPYIYGIFDAGASADRVNAKVKTVAKHALITVDRLGRPQFGLRVTTQ
jgi:hypothetical protein